MNKEDNLIPKDLSKRPDHKELSKKGGKAKSKAKTLANTIKGLKTASDETKNAHFARILSDPDYTYLDIIKFAEQISPKLTKDQIALLNAKIKLAQAVHGDMKKIEHSGKLEVTNIFDKFKELKKEHDAANTNNG